MEITVRAGHPAYYAGEWRFVDGEVMGEPPSRPCPACGLAFKICCVCVDEVAVATAHDPCMGHIENVSSACCGHGGTAEPHILMLVDDPYAENGRLPA